MKFDVPPSIYDYLTQAKNQLAQNPLMQGVSEIEQLRQETRIYQLALELQHKELTSCSRFLNTSQAIAKLGSVEMDVNTKTMRWSPETYRIHDTTPEEYTPTLDNNLDYYPPDSRQKITAAIQQAAIDGKVFDIEVEKYTVKGRKIDLRTTFTAATQQDDTVVWTGIYQDITERKLAERRQQHQNRVLGMLIEQAPLEQILDTIARDIEHMYPDMLCSIRILDSDGKYLRLITGPSLPKFFTQMIDCIDLEPHISCPHLEQRTIIEDIETNEVWANYREVAKQADLRACWSEPIRSQQGKILGLFSLYHRTPRAPTAVEIELLESEARLSALAIEKINAELRLKMAASVFTHAREGILISDPEGNIVEVNETFSDITGYSRNEVIGKTPRILQSGRHSQEFYTRMWCDLIVKGYWSGEVWNKRKNGEIYAELMTISAVRDNCGKTQNYVNIFSDITPFKNHQRQLEYIAHYDALTNLPNRVLLADRLKQAISKSHQDGCSLAVLYIDLDGFKKVNDQHGHEVGDQLLVAVSQQMNAALREGDTLARIGGDEFIAILTELEQPQDYQPIIARLLQATARPVMINDLMLRVSASMGATLYPQDNVDAEQLVRHADQAMYIAKQAGKNACHLFDVERDVAVKNYRENLALIRKGFDENQFVLFYQPKVNMRSGTIIGVEALIRWNHPEYGLLPPSTFLPIIENHPLSLEVGEWVIDTALRQIREWRNLGLEIPISVNIGALQLQHRDFSTRLFSQLALHPEVQLGSLELEILETSALANIAEIAEHMRACHDMGVSFAVDDFGTGYSSLTYLRRLPAGFLKIDQSFIRDMLEDPDDLAIVKGIISLAKAFHRKVIAEGIETIAHGEMLLHLGCELGQGFGIARPMPAAELPRWAKTWRPDSAWTAHRESFVQGKVVEFNKFVKDF